MKIVTPFLLISFTVVVTSASSAQTKVLDMGGVVISVSDSRTAQVFHIVDQMSQWDSGVHHGYVRWAKKTLILSQVDQGLLQKHAELRRVRGWGGGFEQAFYSDDSIEAAARHAVENKILSADEAATEKMILLHFVPILSGMLDQNAPLITAFRARLNAEAKRVAPVVKKLVRFAEIKGNIRLPLFLVSNPVEGNGGGGFNGGVLVVEIEKEPDPLPILLHECLHALLERYKEPIRVAAESIGLSWGELNEGITAAFSPGLTDNLEEADVLAENLTRNFQRGASASDGYAQSKKYMVALIIRPLLRSALKQGETFSGFLPKAVSKLGKFNWH